MARKFQFLLLFCLLLLMPSQMRCRIIWYLNISFGFLTADLLTELWNRQRSSSRSQPKGLGEILFLYWQPCWQKRNEHNVCLTYHAPHLVLLRVLVYLTYTSKWQTSTCNICACSIRVIDVCSRFRCIKSPGCIMCSSDVLLHRAFIQHIVNYTSVIIYNKFGQNVMNEHEFNHIFHLNMYNFASFSVWFAFYPRQRSGISRITPKSSSFRGLFYYA